MLIQEQIEHLRKADPVLSSVIDSMEVPAYRNTHDVFEDLASCILDMRIHYVPTNAAFRYPRLKKLLNGAPINPDTFLNPELEVLGHLKLSHQKDKSLKLWAARWVENKYHKIDWANLTDGEVFALLDGIKGVGEWTVLMILLFTLERPNIFPSSDYQLKKAMCEAYNLIEDKELEGKLSQIANHLHPYKSLATRYLWQWRRNV